MGHGHGHDHGHAPGAGSRRALGLALALTASFMGVELAAGLWSGSLALVADAGHMLNDSAALALSLFVAHLARRPRTPRHTYGFRRAEVMGALANAILLCVAGALVVYEAVGRLGEPPELRGVGMMAAAGLGLLVNVLVALILARSAKESINVRAALLHVLGDLLGSVAALVAGALILGFGWDLADPVASMLIAALILLGAFKLLRDTSHVLMEGVPRDVDVAAVQRTIEETRGVAGVHDLHVWCLVPGTPLLTAHVTLCGGAHGTDVARAVAVRVADGHGIEHSTIQPEAGEPALVELRAARGR